MKKILTIGLFVTGFVINAHAQTTPTSPQAPTTKQETKKEQRKKIMADLNLTSDQKKQMKASNKDFKDKAHAIKDNQALSKQEKKQQYASLKKERTDKMNSFLTPDQQAIVQQDKKAAKHKKPA